jgi:hypothetical protein
MPNQVVQMMAQGAQMLRQTLQQRQQIEAQSQAMTARFAEQQSMLKAREERLKQEEETHTLRLEHMKLQKQQLEQSLAVMPSPEEAQRARSQEADAADLKLQAGQAELDAYLSGDPTKSETASAIMARMQSQDRAISQALDTVSFQRGALDMDGPQPGREMENYLRSARYDQLKSDYDEAQRGVNKLLASPSAPGRAGEERKQQIDLASQNVRFLRAELSYRNRALSQVYTSQGNAALGRLHAAVSAEIGQPGTSLGGGTPEVLRTSIAAFIPEVEADITAALSGSPQAAEQAIGKMFSFLLSKDVKVDPNSLADRQKVKALMSELYEEQYPGR